MPRLRLFSVGSKNEYTIERWSSILSNSTAAISFSFLWFKFRFLNSIIFVSIGLSFIMSLKSWKFICSMSSPLCRFVIYFLNRANCSFVAMLSTSVEIRSLFFFHVRFIERVRLKFVVMIRTAWHARHLSHRGRYAALCERRKPFFCSCWNCWLMVLLPHLLGGSTITFRSIFPWI